MAGKPVLGHILDTLSQIEIDELIFITGYLGTEQPPLADKTSVRSLVSREVQTLPLSPGERLYLEAALGASSAELVSLWRSHIERLASPRTGVTPLANALRS